MLTLAHFRERITAALGALRGGGSKAAPQTAISFDSDYGWRPMTGARWGATYVGSNIDWAKEAGPLWQNPAIALCLGFLFDKIGEAVPEVLGKKGKDRKRDPIVDHPLLLLLAQPNPEYSWKTLLQATATSVKLAGDGYIVKVRGKIGGIRNAGPPRELYYIPHWQMEPLPPDNGGPTQLYKRCIGSKVEFYVREDVIHIRTGMDPENPRKGWSRFKALLREVVSDNEIAIFTASVLRNLGVIGALISPADKGDEFDPGQADELKERLLDETSGDLRGAPVVSSIPIKVERVGFSPQELSIGEMGKRPESRIVAGFGFNPMAVGLPSDNMKYANLKEARAAAWEDSLIPLLTLIAETLTSELLLDIDPTPGQIVAFNYDAVRDLLPDKVAEQKTARDNWQQGIWSLDEARKVTGLPPDTTGSGAKYAWMVMKVKPPQGGGSDNDSGDGNQAE